MDIDGCDPTLLRREGAMTLLLRALAFGAGIVLLEGASSLVHALVLRDIPPELAARGVDLAWMLSRDLLLGALGAGVFALGGLLLRSRRDVPVRAGLSLLAGVLFALLLEAFNWVIPGALLAPARAWQGGIAWSYFVVATLLAVQQLARRDRAASAA
jgi:hypothetical protein